MWWLLLAWAGAQTVGDAADAEPTSEGEAEVTPEAWAQAEVPEIEAGSLQTLTLAPLILRDEAVLVGIANEELRVYLLEQARDAGWPVQGAENPVFGIDKSHRAPFVLGGEVRDVQRAGLLGTSGVEITIAWQLMDRSSERVVYRVTTRGFVNEDEEEAAYPLVWSAMRRVLARPRFAEMLRVQKAAPTDEPTTRLARCGVGARSLPAQLPSVLQAVVRVEQGAGSGSGVLVNADGFVWTAAHVVRGPDPVRVVLADGVTLDAVVVRRHDDADAALVKLPGTGFPCADWRDALPEVGDTLFVAGSPLGAKLQGSVSAGITSAVRELADQTWIQTDAAISPGNSGGPLFDTRGRVRGIVSNKQVGEAVEGIGFGVPTVQMLGALGLVPSEASDEVTEMPATTVATIDDTDDPAIGEGGDARVCVARRTSGAGPALVQVGREKLQLLPRTHRCVPATAGYVNVVYNAGVQRYSLGTNRTLYLRLTMFGLLRANEAWFRRIEATSVAAEP